VYQLDAENQQYHEENQCLKDRLNSLTDRIQEFEFEKNQFSSDNYVNIRRLEEKIQELECQLVKAN
jgi:hypothetical protein